MPKTQINNLLSQLHDIFGDNVPSPQVKQLMQDMRQPHNSKQLDTANALLAEIETEHPHAAAIVRKIIEALDDMGI